jgi:DNA-binding transcriptional MerR regulator
MATRAGHVSIGDVLNQLRDEFPDITISKIRFLESQGLVDPERTPSGYRKFYPDDVERLRFILRQQKDHFLPLKVIKDRLDEMDKSGGFNADGPGPDGVGTDGAGDVTEPTDEPEGTPGGTADAEPGAPAEAKPRKARAKKAPAREPALFEETRRQREEAEARTVAANVDADADAADFGASATGVSMTRAELARAADITDEQLGLLEEFGLVRPAHTARDRVLFDEDALTVARVAAGFMKHGIEPRHLRMYRAFAEREASLFEQVLLPYRRQRNPDAQARTMETLGELSTLGRQLRTAMLRESMRRTLGG